MVSTTLLYGVSLGSTPSGPMTYDRTNPKHRERNREHQRKWYLANKKKQVERTKEVKRQSRDLIRLAKQEGSCKLCGEDHPAVLDFHHRDPKSKSFEICGSYSTRGRLQILAEIEKCDLICANCHRKLHYKGDFNVQGSMS